MIRIVIIGLAVIVVWIAVMQAISFVRTRTIDWTGVAFMVGFVALAFYLRSITDMG